MFVVMKKLLLILLMSFVAIASKAQKCNFSGIKFVKAGQDGQNWYFQTNMGSDSCWGYNFEVYDYQTGDSSISEDLGGYTRVTFYEKGKYQMRLNVFNICLGCDTTFILEINLIIFGDIDLRYAPSSDNCKTYRFEQTEFPSSSCIEYYHSIWNTNEWMDSLSDENFENLNDSIITASYDWNNETPVEYNSTSKRVFFHEFIDSGRYFVISAYYDRCNDIDTMMFTPITVCKEKKTNNIQPIILPADLKIIGYYDMTGRQVYYIQPNQIYVVLYNNGTRIKVSKRQ